jgi:subtilisin family serine protease
LAAPVRRRRRRARNPTPSPNPTPNRVHRPNPNQIPRRPPSDASAFGGGSATASNAPASTGLGPDIRLTQFDAPSLGAQLAEATALIHADIARIDFGLDGSGLTVAVLDSGLRRTHVDFAGRVVATRNFTAPTPGSPPGGPSPVDPTDVRDDVGHGTHVAGVIAASGDHLGIAPGAGIAALKVLSNANGNDFAWLRDALQWTLNNRAALNISCVCMSLGSATNYSSDDSAALGPVLAQIRSLIQSLRAARVAVVVAAGNGYFQFDGTQGMSFPAILRETISVGAVFDANIGPVAYASGAQASATAADRVACFSQRLHPCVSAACRTDVFAPGARTTSTGIANDHGEASMDGTSQAAPIVAGVVLLLQQHFLRRHGELPTVDQLEQWLRAGVVVVDGDDEQDNVTNTGCDFIRVDALRAVQAVR